MNIKTAMSLSKGGRLRLLWKVTGLFHPFYRMSFVASAASCGLLQLLAGGAQPFARLASELAPEPSTHGALEAWLDLGICLGELELSPAGYRLKGYLSRKLASKSNDEVSALVEEVATFHHRLILDTPRRLKKRELWTLGEHDGCLIARSSRIMEPFLVQIIDWALPASRPIELLEVGCGSGIYLRYAAERNPALRAVGIELQPAVAEATRSAVQSWGLQDRITVETGDVRERPEEARFDVVTLYNLIYYFPVKERVALFKKLSGFLKPGGRLIVSTSCQGGSPGMRLLNLWTSSTAGFGPLPTKDQLVAQMREAGFAEITAKKAIPGEQYFAFLATKAP